MNTQNALAIARIYGNMGVVGAGFLVNHRLVITCAHVVNQSLGKATDSIENLLDSIVQIDFPLVAPNHFVRARVTSWHPQLPNGAGDIAALEIIDELPFSITPVPLKTSSDLWGHAFRAFGFPNQFDNGVWVSGRVLGRDATGFMQIEEIKQTGYFIQPGFSGAPIWDEIIQGVIGMVVSADITPGVRIAFIIPVDILVNARLGIDSYMSVPSSQSKHNQELLLEALSQEIISQNFQNRKNLNSIRTISNEYIFQAPPRNERFVGRNSVSKRILHQLASKENKQAIIHGMGGVGKSSLAIQITHSLQSEFTDGVLWANMNSSKVVDVMNQFGHALGIDLSQIDNLENQASNLRGAMSGKKYLVVLDDVQTNSQIEHLIPSSDSIGLLVTTRLSNLSEIFSAQLAKALFIQLDVLSFENSYALISKILGTRNISSEKESIKNIVKLLGGMPLALEIAASKLAIEDKWAAKDYLKELKKQITSALEVNNRKGVFSSLDLSWNALSNYEQVFFSNLSIFKSNKFYLEAARAATNTTEDEAIKFLERLTTLSLIYEIDNYYYRLHPLIVSFLEKKAHPNERRFIQLSGFYLKFTQIMNKQLEFNNYSKVIEMDQEMPNIRLIMRWAINSPNQAAKEILLSLTMAISGYLHLRNHWEDSATWNLAAIDQITENDDLGIKQIYLTNIGYSQLKLGFLEQSLRCLEQVQSSELTDEDTRITSLFYSGLVYRRLGDYDEALSSYKECLSHYQEKNNQQGAGACLTNIGIIWRRRGDYKLALDAFYKAVATYKAIDNNGGLAYCYGNIGNTLQRQGKYEEALSNHLRALQIRKEINDIEGQANSLGNLGTTYRDIGNFEKALDMYYQSLEFRKNLGLKWETANSQRGIGFTYLELALDAFGKRKTILKNGYNKKELEKVITIIETLKAAIDDYLPYRKKRK